MRVAAELLAAEGAKVVITGRSEKKGAAIAERLGENAPYLASDAKRFVNCHDLVVEGGRRSMFHEKPEAFS
jgi:NAD(P)-dependent dehydrogenase (short-subunit alcohol dehydrogenase family)